MSKHSTFGPRRETALSKGFTIFLPLLADFVEAERDLEDIKHSDDVALSLWTRDRDVAKARLQIALNAMHRLSVRLPEDRPLRNVVILVDRMLDDSETLFPRQLHREMKACFFSRFQVAGFGPVAQHRNAMLIQARHLVDALVALPFYDHVPTVDLTQVDDLEEHDLLVSAF